MGISILQSLLILIAITTLQLHPITSFTITIQQHHQNPQRTSSTQLHSLKPAAIPLLDSGKALARSGELLIDYTSTSVHNLYAGGLSSSGASIRNAGDCIAQAAASMRFKTASELVCDELRESSTCLLEAYKEHLPKGVDDARVDDAVELVNGIERLVAPMKIVGDRLELSGERIMKRDTVMNVGSCLVDAAESLEILAVGIQSLGDVTVAVDSNGEKSDENEESIKAVRESGTRMLYAAEKMKEAGNNLKGVLPPKKKGKAWLKG